MTATMARQGGRVQLEQSDMRLALNMAKMAKEGFSRTATEEAHHQIKKPRAEVREETKQGVVIPGHYKVMAAIERHQAMVLQNQTDSCLPCQNGRAKHTQTRCRRKRNGCTNTTTGATEARNATSATWCQWHNSNLRNRRCATQICVYTFPASLRSVSNLDPYAKDPMRDKDFIPDLLSDNGPLTG